MNIVKCSYCSLQGMTKNLAEVLPDGTLKILRMVKEDEDGLMIDFTLVKANEYQLSCGSCGNMVLYRQPIAFSPQVNILNAWGTIMTYYHKLI